MLTLFEVYLTDETDPDALLSEEVIRETNAQVMTPEHAAKVGFGGLPAPALPGKRIFIAVIARDAPFIQRRLEGHAGATNFKIHHVDG